MSTPDTGQIADRLAGYADSLREAGAIRTHAVHAAFATVPRHRFLPHFRYRADEYVFNTSGAALATMLTWPVCCYRIAGDLAQGLWVDGVACGVTVTGLLEEVRAQLRHRALPRGAPCEGQSLPLPSPWVIAGVVGR